MWDLVLLRRIVVCKRTVVSFVTYIYIIINLFSENKKRNAYALRPITLYLSVPHTAYAPTLWNSGICGVLRLPMLCRIYICSNFGQRYNKKCRMQNAECKIFKKNAECKIYKKTQNAKFTKKGDPKVALKIVSANLLLLQYR